MSDSSSAPDTKENVFGNFYEELEKAKDKEAVVRKYAEAYPQWAGDFGEEAALEQVLGQSQPAAEDALVDLPDFRIIREIARGGMGIVYEAEQLSLKRHVAVKVRHGRPAPGAHDRFSIEQEVLAKLHQTHIVPIHTAGQAGPWQYFAMAYIEGAALHRVVRETRHHTTCRHGVKTPTLGELAGEVLKQADGKGQSPALAANPAPGLYTTGDIFQAGRPDDHPQDGEKTVPSDGRSVPLSPARVTLSLDYFRSVARVMADAAEALEHSHAANILHRDIKPSNIMVDTAGQCWLIDFGVARFLNGRERVRSQPADAENSARPALTQGPLGTPQYMAPEQYEARADARSDVWGLGVTLYELLTLCRAFEGEAPKALRAKIVAEEPEPPQNLVDNVPVDLAAICRKAMRKRPEQRYQTAGEFANDLRRWLGGEPTKARPAWPLRRVALWARRNKGWAVAIGVGLLSLMIGAVGSLLVLDWRATAAKADARAAQAEAKGARENEVAAKRELLVQELERVRLAKHEAEWSTSAWAKVRELKQLGQIDRLRDLAAATLIGPDAKVRKHNSVDVSAVAFDPDGSHLFFAEAQDRVHIWDKGTELTQTLDLPGFAGPFAFRKDGAAVQIRFFRDKPSSVELWDVRGRRRLLQFLGGDSKWTGVLDLAVSPGGKLIGVAAETKDRKGVLSVFDGTSGKILHQWSHRASTLAFAPDGNLVAGGAGDGTISLWTLPDGKFLTSLQGSTNAIRTLAIGPDPRRRTVPVAGWLLASGDAGGLITVWDLAYRIPRSYCRGSNFDVYALAFHPDGATLASSGRSNPKLWDVATGRLLLNLKNGDFATGLAFSSDGSSLAVSAITGFGPGGLDIWRLENGQGLQTLYGLGAQVVKVVYSRNGARIAALAHNWDLAVWDAKSGHLLYLFEPPPGFSADNAAIAFDAEARRLAWAAGTRARLWDLASGKLLREWNDLPPGLADQIAFHPTGKLLLLRVETQDGKQIPAGGAHPKQYPRVCRLRDLLAADPTKPLQEIKDFNWHVFGTVAAAHGSYFIVDGLGGPGGKQRTIAAFDGLTGKQKWSKPSRRTHDNTTLLIDSSGKRAAFLLENPFDRMTLVEAATGNILDSIDIYLKGLADGNGYCGSQGPPPGGSLSLLRLEDRKLLVTLGIDGHLTSIGTPFSPSGSSVAWGNVDGTVTVCDIPAIQQRLAEVELGW